MNDFCGWAGNVGLATDIESALTKMSDGLPPAHNTFRVAESDFAALGRDAHSQAGIHAVISGRPRWSDQQYQAIASQRGDACALISAYQNLSEELFNVLSGPFGFVLVDTNRNVTILAIDRFGIQRLCYTLLNGGVCIFGTTLDAVRRFPGLEAKVESQSIFDFLYFHMIPSPTSIYSNICKIEAGQCLVIRAGVPSVRRYWQPDFVDKGKGESGLIEALQQELRNAVRKCVPDNGASVGAFLSGGLDSSTVCGLLSEIVDRPAKAYTIGFDQAGFDEMEYARIAARHFGLDLHEYYVTPKDVADVIPKIARAYDEPFGNSSAVPTLVCAQLAKKDGADLLLAGDGGDELFGGNVRYARQKLFSLYESLPGWLRSGLLEPVFCRSPIGRIPGPTAKLQSYIQQANVPMPLRLETYNFLYRTPASEMFTPAFLENIDLQSPISHLNSVWQSCGSTSLLNRMMFLDWKITLADNDIRKVNQMCQLADIGVAYPMLDDDLATLSTTIPPALKLRRFELRSFYKNALRGFLPNEIINKSKHGFGLPFGDWLKTSSEIKEIVHPSLAGLKNRQIVRADFIDRLLHSHRTEHAAYFGELVWVFTQLEQWLQHRRLSL